MNFSGSSSSTPVWRAAVLSCLVLPLGATGAPFLGAQEKLCVAGVVDKDKLAAFVIEYHPISMQVYTAHPELRPGDPLSKTMGALLRDENACLDKCGSGDQASLKTIKGSVTYLLRGAYAPEYMASTTANPAQYFSGSQDQDPIACGPHQAAANDPDKKDEHVSKWRVRGDPTQLFIEQRSVEFKSVDTAILSLSRDEVADTRTSRVFGYLGYALALDGKDGARITKIVPYLGVNRNIVRVNGAVANDKSSDTVDVGVIAYLFRAYGSATGTGISHAVDLGADFLADRLDSSRLISFNVDYRPIKTHGVNGVVEWNGLNVFPTLALRVKAGHYTRRAEGAAGDGQENFTRAGAALGIVFASGDSASLPLEFSNTYVGLASSGGKPSVSFFKHSLTWSLDDKHRFGLALNYEHGRREDTLKNVKLWEMALSYRY